MTLGDPTSVHGPPVTAPTSTHPLLRKLRSQAALPIGCPEPNPSNAAGCFTGPLHSFLTSLPLLGDIQWLSNRVSNGDNTGSLLWALRDSVHHCPSLLFRGVLYFLSALGQRVATKKALIKWRIEKTTTTQGFPQVRGCPIKLSMTTELPSRPYGPIWNPLATSGECDWEENFKNLISFLLRSKQDVDWLPRGTIPLWMLVGSLGPWGRGRSNRDDSSFGEFLPNT